MKKVTQYQSEDGKIFSTELEAVRHDRIKEFEEWYNNNTLLGNYAGCRVDFLDLLEWLDENMSEIRELLLIL